MLDDKNNPRGFDDPNDYASMHGERYCGAAKEVTGSSYPEHCFHRSGDDLVCCWCGDVFVGDHGGHTTHGDNYHPLTRREVETATLMAQGLSNKQIADQLGVSDHTAKFFVRATCAKLGHSTRAGAAAEAVRRGIVP